MAYSSAMSRARELPAWVKPDPRQIDDYRALTQARLDAGSGDGRALTGRLTAVDTVLAGMDYDQACAAMNDAVTAKRAGHDPTYNDAAAETYAWLLMGIACPIDLPRRHPDGAVVTADELYAERAEPHWSPERRAAERDKARHAAARWAALAYLA